MWTRPYSMPGGAWLRAKQQCIYVAAWNESALHICTCPAGSKELKYFSHLIKIKYSISVTQPCNVRSLCLCKKITKYIYVLYMWAFLVKVIKLMQYNFLNLFVNLYYLCSSSGSPDEKNGLLDSPSSLQNKSTQCLIEFFFFFLKSRNVICFGKLYSS